MNSESAMSALCFALGGLLFALVQLLQLDIEEWKGKQRDKEDKFNNVKK